MTQNEQGQERWTAVPVICEATLALEDADALKCAEFPDDESKRCYECLGCGRALSLEMARVALKTTPEVS